MATAPRAAVEGLTRGKRRPREGTGVARVLALIAASRGLSRLAVAALAPDDVPAKTVLAAINALVHRGLVVAVGYGKRCRLFVAGTEPGAQPSPANLTYYQQRARRAHRGRKPLVLGRDDPLPPREPYPDVERPRTRADCEHWARPCPFVSCVYHLYLDVSPSNGAIKLNFPDLEPHELEVSCSLDVADRGGASLEEAGEALNITRERVRQIEVRALATLERERVIRQHAAELHLGGLDGRRRLPLLPGRAA